MPGARVAVLVHDVGGRALVEDGRQWIQTGDIGQVAFVEGIRQRVGLEDLSGGDLEVGGSLGLDHGGAPGAAGSWASSSFRASPPRLAGVPPARVRILPVDPR